MKHSITTYRRWAKMHKVEGNHRQPLNVEHAQEHDCMNCGTHYRGNFCPNCGQTHNTHRFSVKDTLQHVAFFFMKFDSSFWRTCAELFYRPGHMIRDYIHGHRIDYFRPIQMLVCLITVYILLTVVFHVDITSKDMQRLEEASDVALQGHTVMLTIMNYLGKLMHNMVFVTMVMVVLCVVPNRLCFRKTEIGRDTNMAEHFYIRVYVSCQVMIADLLLFFPMMFIGRTYENQIAGLLEFVLLVWDYKQYFKISWLRSLWLNTIAFLLVILIIGVLVIGTIFLLGIAGLLR